MKQFRKILLVLDPEAQRQPALERAAELARLHGASLHVLTVLEDLPLELKIILAAPHPGELRERLEHQQRTRVEAWLAPLREQGIDLHLDIQWHQAAFLAIIREVLRHGHDLLIKTTEGATGAGAVLFHPTDRHLMRKCPCPVWMVKPEPHPAYKRILAAVDPFPDEPENHTFNARILELAASIAALDRAELHVVHAHQEYDAITLEHLGVDVGDTAERSLVLRRQGLDRLLANLSVAETRRHLLLGPPEEVIPKLASCEGIELIVMGTVARTGIPGLLIGNTAERILDGVECDVLAIKPEGFVTPVTLTHSE
jgi:nucleotide-binding universal stress UspA family protein